MKRFFISALEHSGDIAGAELAKSIRRQLLEQGEDAEFFGFGGSAMKDAGVKILENTVDNAIMGFTAVVAEIPRLLRLMHRTAKFIRTNDFDAVIVIDAPDFNIRFAKLLQSLRPRTKLVYFIIPQVWAWRRGRTRQIQKYFDVKLSVFPFETRWFRNRYVDAHYIGNPTARRVKHFLTDFDRETERERFNLPKTLTKNTPIVAILPGSRRSEIKHLLTVQIETMNELAKEFPDLTGILAGAPDRSLEIYAPHLQNVKFNLKIAVPNKAKTLVKSGFDENSDSVIINDRKFEIYEATALTVMHVSDAGFVCSGTATLEAALLELPTVVGYISSPINFWIARMLVQIKTISIANLCLEQTVFPEIVQGACTTETALGHLQNLLTNEYRDFFKEQHEILWNKIGDQNPFEEGAMAILP